MAKEKQEVATKQPWEVALYGHHVRAPEALTLSDATRNEEDIAAWWERAKLYANAMRDLGRVTMLCCDDSKGGWYLASVPAVVRLTPTTEATR